MVTIAGLGALFQIQLVQDLVTASGFTSTEVFSGIATVLMIFYVVLAIFEVKT